MKNRVITLLLCASCAAAAGISIFFGGRDLVTEPPDQFQNADDDIPRLLLFAQIPPDYLRLHVQHFADLGVSGVMMSSIMWDWSSDVWAQPDGFSSHASHPVRGPRNKLFQQCKDLNRRCRELGMADNSISVGFFTALPDWFDDRGWSHLRENLRQGAIFARDAGFAGINLDIEYAREQYNLAWKGYQVPGYPLDRIHTQARLRGQQIMEAMLDEFPGMVFWQMPETVRSEGPLGAEFFLGTLEAMARRDAPGGLHLCLESTYFTRDPVKIPNRIHLVENLVLDRCTPAMRDYWLRRCTTAPGMYPLGYYREVVDADGTFLGYSGRRETFGDRIVGSYADKSQVYSPDQFRRQYAAAIASTRRYTWLYLHGSVLWRMTPDEMTRFHGRANDTLPLAPNIGEFLDILRKREVFSDRFYTRACALLRDHHFSSDGWGHPPRWSHAGSYPAGGPLGWHDGRMPMLPALTDTTVWIARPVNPARYVDLRHVGILADSAVVWSTTRVSTPSPMNTQMLFGSNGYSRVWIGEMLVHEIAEARLPEEDVDTVAVMIPAGVTRLTVQTANFRRWWGHSTRRGFYLRFADADGEGDSRLRFPQKKRSGP
jgi:hypothetical protein